MKGSVVLIPAYRPPVTLPALIKEILKSRQVSQVIVVDDGSEEGWLCHEDWRLRIEDWRLRIIDRKHKGKGAALRAGLAEAYRHLEGHSVVTADADGQHTAKDILRVAEYMDLIDQTRVVTGSRTGPMPWRSRLGNAVARFLLYRCGVMIHDTQCGLRGIPWPLVEPLSKLPYDGYDFETAMLLAAHRDGWIIRDLPIGTVYEKGNRSSHFRPLRDSWSILKVIVKEGLLRP